MEAVSSCRINAFVTCALNVSRVLHTEEESMHGTPATCKTSRRVYEVTVREDAIEALLTSAGGPGRSVTSSRLNHGHSPSPGRRWRLESQDSPTRRQTPGRSKANLRKRPVFLVFFHFEWIHRKIGFNMLIPIFFSSVSFSGSYFYGKLKKTNKKVPVVAQWLTNPPRNMRLRV